MIRQRRPSFRSLRGQERRCFRRVPFQVMAMVEAQQGDDGQICKAKDLSCGGMGLSSVSNLELGQQVQVRFDLPGRMTLECDAEVIRSGSHDLGLRFTDMNAVMGQLLHDYVQQQSLSTPLLAS